MPKRQKKEETSKKESKFVDNALGITVFLLTELQNASQLAPIPFIRVAASLALEIVSDIQVCTFVESSMI
jgi:hypothetical protein